MTESVSVALAACRGGRHLEQQLRSLAGQSRRVDEVVICDDSPDDATGAVAAECRKRLALDIRYERNMERLGVAGNFAKAVSLCRGDIIFLCDQDDFWLPGKVEKMLGALAGAPDASGVFCDSRLADENLNELDGTLWRVRGFTAARQKRFAEAPQLPQLLQRVRLSTHNIAFRAAMRQYLLPFPEMPGLYPDTWIAQMLSASGGRWLALPECLTLYRLHGANLSRPGDTGLFARIGAARRGLRNGHLTGRRMIAEALLERLPRQAENNRPLLERYLAFCRARESLSPRFCKRLFAALRLWGRGDYRRFDRCWRTLAVDLFLRGQH